MIEQLSSLVESEEYNSQYITKIGMLNVVAEAKYDMPLVSQKLFIEALAAIDPNKDDFDIINIPLNYFADKNNVNRNYISANALKIADNTLNAKILIRNAENTNEWILKTLFEDCKYKNGLYTIKLSNGVKPYFLNIYDQGGNYFKFIKEYISTFSSKFTMKLYLLCQSNLYKCKNKERVHYTVKYLRDFYDLTDGQYTEFKKFNSRIINVALTEINEKTNLYVVLEKITANKVVIGFDFIVKEKRKYIAEIKQRKYNEHIIDFIIKEYLGITNKHGKHESIILGWFDSVNPYVVYYFAEQSMIASDNCFNYLSAVLKKQTNNFKEPINIFKYIANLPKELSYIQDQWRHDRYDYENTFLFIKEYLSNTFAKYIEIEGTEILEQYYNDCMD